MYLTEINWNKILAWEKLILAANWLIVCRLSTSDECIRRRGGDKSVLRPCGYLYRTMTRHLLCAPLFAWSREQCKAAQAGGEVCRLQLHAVATGGPMSGDGGGNDGRIDGGVIVGFVLLIAIITFIVVLCKRHGKYITEWIIISYLAVQPLWDDKMSIDFRDK